MRRLLNLAFSAGLALLLSMAPTARAQELALGSDGELFSVLAGPYGELFGDGAVAADSPVLALDVSRPGEATERLLVPGTDDAFGDIEGSSALVYEDSSGTLFLVWESRRNVIHPLLNLISFDGTQWAEPLVIMSNVFALKGSPRLAITHDTYTVQEDESVGAAVEALHRAVLHLVWWEEGSAGTEVLYTPIVLDNGSYDEAPPVIFRLNDFVSQAGGSAPAMTEAFVRHPVLFPGLEHRSVMVGFTDALTGQFLTVEITVLPGELGLIADGVRETIDDSGYDFDPEGLTSFADLVRGNIIDIGRTLNQRNVSFMADDVRGNIIDIGRNWTHGLTPFADTIRGNIIDIGSNLFGGEFARLYDSDSYFISEISTPDASAPQTHSHFLSLRVVSQRPLMDTDQAPAAIFLSESGEQVLVAWEGDGRLLYRESTSAGWSDLRSLELGDRLDAESGYQILQERTRTR
ncbi:MAG: hypothetical protein KDD11_14915 [Acidobacteria bacterium]|nr:hypothetical protein [Acidobacteriota bacterium]